MSSANKPTGKNGGNFKVRDDNLRLIFSETELKILKQKRSDAITGFKVIGVLILTTLIFYLLAIATPVAKMLDGTAFEPIKIIFGMILYVAAILCCLSPIIMIGLLIELRKAAKAKASLLDLLVRYKRPIPKTN